MCFNELLINLKIVIDVLNDEITTLKGNNFIEYVAFKMDLDMIFRLAKSEDEIIQSLLNIKNAKYGINNSSHVVYFTNIVNELIKYYVGICDK